MKVPRVAKEIGYIYSKRLHNRGGKIRKIGQKVLIEIYQHSGNHSNSSSGHNATQRPILWKQNKNSDKVRKQKHVWHFKEACTRLLYKWCVCRCIETSNKAIELIIRFTKFSREFCGLSFPFSVYMEEIEYYCVSILLLKIQFAFSVFQWVEWSTICVVKRYTLSSKQFNTI